MGYVHIFRSFQPLASLAAGLTSSSRPKVLGEGCGRGQLEQPQAPDVVEGGRHGALPEAASPVAAAPAGGTGLAQALHEPG